jgi:predicted lipid-binding transport protein (Tim44 family)
MHDPLDASTIIFALLAIFVLWKLRSVLGSRTGSEKQQPPQNSFFRRPGGTNDNDDHKVIPLPGAAPARSTAAPALPPAAAGRPTPQGADRWKAYAEPGSKNAAALDDIAATDPTFDLVGFIAGAKTAYEMIVTAFAAGDRQTLRNLLDQDVYESFVTAIAGRESRGETMKTTLVSIDKVGVDDVGLRATTAQLTLRFASKLISVTENSAGTIIEGSPERVVDMIDIWTFARDSRSTNPNWKLVATQTGH